MAGQQHVADELTAEISPGFTLESERPEWEFLKGAKLMSAPLNVAGAALTLSAFRFRNPAQSGVVAIFGGEPNGGPAVEITLQLVGGGTASVQFQSQPDSLVNLSATLAAIPRDTRYTNVAANTSALVCSQTNNLVVGAGDIFHGGAAATFLDPLKFYFTFVLTPGNELNIVCVDANTNTRGGIMWLEKRLDQLEVQ